MKIGHWVVLVVVLLVGYYAGTKGIGSQYLGKVGL